MLRRGILTLTVTTFVTVLFVLGCGLYPEKPTQELADAKAAQEEAKAASAPEHAPEEYAAAEELLAKGEELIDVECKVEESRKLLLDARSKFIEAREKGLAEKAKLAQPPPPPPPPAPLPLDKSDIRADAVPVLQENAELLKANPGVRVLVEGYCDIRGSIQYNLALGQRRAQATKDFLVQQGIDPGRIDIVSQGETTKFGAGTTERAFQLNRRAHFVPQAQPGM